MTGEGRMYVIVNSDLKMSNGKVAAQVAHAVARVGVPAPKTVIVLVGNTNQLYNLNNYVNRLNLPHHLYIDEGVNEVPPMSVTALAIGNYADDFIPDYLQGFNLLREKSLWQKLLKR